MTRFFVQPEQIADGRVTLTEGDARHLRVVLQAKAGEVIAVLDGSGREWPATLETVGKVRAEARLGTPLTPDTEPAVRITVAQALPKMAEKMEQVLQRGTEIGAARFWAYQCERSLTHLTGERHEKRLARWQGIVKTAAEQAHRALLPTLAVAGDLGTVLASIGDYDLALLAHPDDQLTTLHTVFSDSPRIGGGGADSPRIGTLLGQGGGTILVIVGPESGFTNAEVRRAQGVGVKAVTLGPRILRTETAAMVMVAQILFALEQSPVR